MVRRKSGTSSGAAEHVRSGAKSGLEDSEKIGGAFCLNLSVRGVAFRLFAKGLELAKIVAENPRSLVPLKSRRALRIGLGAPVAVGGDF